MQDRTSIPKDETVLNIPAPMSVDNPKKKNRFFLLALVLVLVIIAGIVGVVAYQNHVNQVNQTNAENAYLSALTGSGTLDFSDPLNNADQSKWIAASGDAGSCQFQGNAFHLKQQSNQFVICNAQVGGIQDFAFEVQLSIIQGGCGGMVFREGSTGSSFDYFYICESGRGVDHYNIVRYAGYLTDRQLPYGDSSAIHVGLGQQNTLAVRAVGGNMTFYINEQQVAQAQDPDGYMQGGIGLAVYPPGLNDPSEVAFTNARLWTL